MEIPMPTLREVHRRWMTENSTIPDGLRRLMKEIDSRWRVERKVS